MSRSAIVSAPLDVAALLTEVNAPSNGAVCTFIGTVRNSSDGRNVTGLEYSAYTEMATREMDDILREVTALENGVEIVAVHRIGALRVGEPCVVIAAAHAHRNAAFVACRYVIEEIKKRVPIWKRELYEDGTHEWVNACANGDSDAVSIVSAAS